MSFKKGQRIKVLLDETHNLVDDHVSLLTLEGHDAVFVAEHGDGKWADVELDEEHNGKTRRLSVPLSVIKAATCLLFALLSFFPLAARAQFVGYVGLQTVSTSLATNVSCSGATQTFTPPNLGQISHQASATSTAPTFTVEIDGVDTTGAVYRISNGPISFANTGTTSYIAQGYGYYAIVQVKVVCSTGSTFSLSYSGGQGSFSQIIGPPSGNTLPTGGTFGNVQGVIASGVNANSIFPVLVGAQQPAIPAQLSALGLDTFGVSPVIDIPGGFTGNVTQTPPTPSGSGEWGFATFGPFNGTSNSFSGSNWVCIPGATCTGNLFSSGPDNAALSLGAGNQLTGSITNSTQHDGFMTVFLIFKNVPGQRNYLNGNFSTSITTTGNTLANSVLLLVANCNTTQCNLAPTDTQGNTWRQVAVTATNTSAGQVANGLAVWLAGPTTAAAETITFNALPGTSIRGSSILELTGLSPASPNTPLSSLVSSAKSFAANENDNGGLFIENGGFSVTQTLTLSAAGTFTVPLWSQAQHGVFQSCTFSQRVTNIAGAGTTLNTFLQDSADGLGWNDRLSMVQSTTAGGANNQLGAIASGTGITPAATTDGALAAGSKLDGPVSQQGRLKFVTTGAAVSVTLTYNVVCR